MRVRKSSLAMLAGIIVITLVIVRLARAAMLAPGAEMPEWSLPDQNGQVVRSGELAGHSYLLWFYPKAMTPGCTAEARGLRDEYAKLAAAGVTVLGVSFDDASSNKQFVEGEKLPFRLLSDSDRKLAVALGAADSSSAFFARRISYLVGPDGHIRKTYDNVDPAAHAAQVLRDASPAPAEP